eukprot:SAG11_NODE_1786_length_4258_cov_1.965617_8_plen_94_part_00
MFEGRLEGFVLRYHNKLEVKFKSIAASGGDWILATEWAEAMRSTLQLNLPWERLLDLMTVPENRGVSESAELTVNWNAFLRRYDVVHPELDEL